MHNFTSKAQKALMDSGWVQKITKSHVVFTPEFKIKAVQLNLEGFNPTDIFSSLGLNPAFFHEELPKKSISRWKKIYLENGEDSFREERRGKSSTGRPKRKFDKSDLKSMEERIAYLEAENFVLKKLRALEEEEFAKKKRSR